MDRYPAGDWHLAFELVHEYDTVALSWDGIIALRGADWRNVIALSTAAGLFAIEELDFLFCNLEWVENENHDVIDEEDAPMSRMKLIDAYWDTGRSCSCMLDWVDWGSAVDKTRPNQPNSG